MILGYFFVFFFVVFMVVFGSVLLVQVCQDDLLLFNCQVCGEFSEYGGVWCVEQDLIQVLKQLLLKKKVKNVILLIGDGMGDFEIIVVCNYVCGVGGYFKGIDVLLLIGQYIYYFLYKDSGLLDYVIDFVVFVIVWIIGVKLYNGVIGVDIYEQLYCNLLELVKFNGKVIGNVFIVELQDVIFVVLFVYVIVCKCYGFEVISKQCLSNVLENGGVGLIIEQWLKICFDVVFGGGVVIFVEIVKVGCYVGKIFCVQVEVCGYWIVENFDELKVVCCVNQKQLLIGLFVLGNMLVCWFGLIVIYYGNLNQLVVSCEVNLKCIVDILILV